MYYIIGDAGGSTEYGTYAQLDATGTAQGAQTQPGSRNLTIGALESNRGHVGLVDDVRIYSRILSESEVQQLAGQQISTYMYDGDSARVKKTESGQTTVYVNRFYEKNLTTSEATLSYYHGGRLVGLKKGSTLEYVHQDHLTGTAVSSDTAGALKSSIKYLPFGETRASTGTLGTDKKFTGQRLDGTGLYFYNARYYDPSIGRFVSADITIPSLDPQHLNRYSYVRNNPLLRIDPNGRDDVAVLQGIFDYYRLNPTLSNRFAMADAIQDLFVDAHKNDYRVQELWTENRAAAAFNAVADKAVDLGNAIADKTVAAAQKVGEYADDAAMWANPNNAVNNFLGLALAVTSGGDWDYRDGVVVVENAGGPAGKFLDLVDKDAFTVGNVVLARDKLPEASTSYQHERNHVDQYQIFGPFFPPTYGLFQAAGWAISSVTDDPNDAPEDYNLFEIWAGDY